MGANKRLKIALVGSPNVGKSSLFNQLTGLNQKIGNYPGITVDKKYGRFTVNQQVVEVIDLPGTYSLFASSKDEEIVFNLLTDTENRNFPDKIILIADASNLKRSLLLFQQIKDLGFPVLLVLNMMDEAKRKGLIINEKILEKLLGVTIIKTNARKGKGIDLLKKSLIDPIERKENFTPPPQYKRVVKIIQEAFDLQNPYIAWQYLTQKKIFYLRKADWDRIQSVRQENHIIPKRLQVKEIIDRYAMIDGILERSIQYKEKIQTSFTEKIDRVLTHKIFGLLIFLGVLLFIFQALFTWSSIPMDWIDHLFNELAVQAKHFLPSGPVNGLISEGIIPGIGGVVIFVPQIAILFLFISIMEETGYMARVVFMMDKLMRPFGLSGKSVVPLMSGAACAIPAIMSARNIENDRERLISILVTPFITCSARLPVYAILIAIIVPEINIIGLSLQGVVLMSLYLLGAVTALISAFILKTCIKSKYKSFLFLELPNYQFPLWKSVALSVYQKSRAFVIGAGKIILAISIILWVLGSNGPQDTFEKAALHVKKENPSLSNSELNNKIAAYKLENSYLGKMGKAIEPVIQPLGYEWKMGVGLIASFAAREVFVGTLASIYSIGEVDDTDADRQKMKDRLSREINPHTGKPVINYASGTSLLLFYAFAMQCMSTIAVVKKETKTWKWPMIQLIFMTGLAYLSAMIAYQFLK